VWSDGCSELQLVAVLKDSSAATCTAEATSGCVSALLQLRLRLLLLQVVLWMLRRVGVYAGDGGVWRDARIVGVAGGVAGDVAGSVALRSHDAAAFAVASRWLLLL